MGEAKEADVTQLLSRWSAGDRAALDSLVPAVYRELRRMAARYLRRERSCDDRRVVLARLTPEGAALHRELMPAYQEQMRAAMAGLSADEIESVSRCCEQLHRMRVSNHIDIIAVDDALNRLAIVDPDQVRLVELRFFGGLTIEETAEVLGWSSGSVKREWTVARAWLQREISGAAHR